MGLLRGIRRLTRKSGHALTAGFGELDAVFLPERHHQLDGVKSLKSMSVMRDDTEAGAPPFGVDLNSGTAVIKPRPPRQ